MTTLEPGQREERAINEPAPTLDGASPPPSTSPTAQRDPRSRLPVDPRTGDSIPPKAQPGYYPGYHTLDNQSFWDAATRKVVLKRVNDIPPVRFFTQEEAALLEAVIARVLPQDDRDAEHRIPILPHLDEKLYQGKGPGYQYRDMPPDGEVFKLGLQAIEAIALHVYNRPFQALDPHEQDYVLESIHDGHPQRARHSGR
jgi:hypothetical protein